MHSNWIVISDLMILAETIQSLGIAIPTVQSRIMTQVITNKLTTYVPTPKKWAQGRTLSVSYMSCYQLFSHCEVSSYNTPNACFQ